MGKHERRLAAAVAAVSLLVPGKIAWDNRSDGKVASNSAVAGAGSWDNAEEMANMGLGRESFDSNVIFACHRRVEADQHHYTLTLRKTPKGLVMRVTGAGSMDSWRDETGESAKATIRDLGHVEKKLGDFDLERVDTLEAGKPESGFEADLGRLLRPGKSYVVSLAVEDRSVNAGGVRFATIPIEDMPSY